MNDTPITPVTAAIEPPRRATDAETLKAEILDKLTYAVGKDPIVAQPHDWLAATILAVRDRVIDRWMEFDPERLPRPAPSGSTTSRSSS